MNKKKLQDLIRNAELLKNTNYAAQALEDYFREVDPNIDLWWFRQEVEDLTNVQEQLQQLRVLQEVAGVDTIKDLETHVINGLRYKEQRDEELDTLLDIKKELSSVYVKLVKSLT